jgi:hypothetical protein
VAGTDSSACPPNPHIQSYNGIDRVLKGLLSSYDTPCQELDPSQVRTLAFFPSPSFMLETDPFVHTYTLSLTLKTDR